MLFFSWTQAGAQYFASVIAGGGAPQGLPAGSVGIGYPTGVTKDNAGNLYFSSANQNRVYKVDVHGILTTVAGNGNYGFSGDGDAAINATLSSPGGLVVDQSGSIYVSDQNNYRVRKVTNGVISTIAGNGNSASSGDGGPATSAGIGPADLALDRAGNLYIVDFRRIRKVSNGIISTVAGGPNGPLGDGGPALSANIAPTAIAIDGSNNLYIADYGNNRIRVVSNNTITTMAGNGIRQFSGDGGPALTASLNAPVWVSVDSGGNVYFSEQLDGRVRKVSEGVITTVAGDGSTTYSGDNAPATSVGLSAAGVFADAGNLYIADSSSNKVRVVSNGIISTAAGNGTPGYMGDGMAATATTLAIPTSVAVDHAGNVYIADSGDSRIRKVSGGQISTIASLTQCPLLNGCSYYVTVDQAGRVFFTDLTVIKMFNGGIVTTIAGNGTVVPQGDGPALTVGISPDMITTDGAGNVYFSENRSKVRKVSNGMVTTVAGSNNFALGDGGPALSANLFDINGLAVDSAGNLYITDSGHYRIRKVTNGVITTIAGNGVQGSSGDGGPAIAASVTPSGLTQDANGNLYFLDASGIRMISNGNIATIAGLDSFRQAAGLSIQIDSAGNFYMAGEIVNRVFEVSRTGYGNPIGSFDTPLNNTSGIAGAIPVTGWALDNVGISKIQIWREPLANEPVASNNLVYIGDAVQIAGTRPDVQRTYPNMPFNDRAGWGYMLLTNFLPGVSAALGNGTYRLHAIAYNNAGGQTDLGTRTIAVDNAHAAKPFGTIDTPAQGATISGNAYVNFGWTLTQNPYCIPNDGHTITVSVDGVPSGHPAYNQNRSDIATLFPGLCNSNGGVGFFYIDTTKLANGLHTIAWVATDNQNRTDGIGSRYFTVQNAGGLAAPEEAVTASMSPRRAAPQRSSYTVEVEELDRIELDLGAVASEPLPVGSTLKDGVFYWQLGPGFLGEYRLHFTRADGTGAVVHVTVRPKTYRRD
ncbi:MAG TPA: hypothetical protein VH157_12820 [Bryobacteraceae bacterium]|nr:hypothetical protein [Bryobacteraceae bacterium]